MICVNQSEVSKVLYQPIICECLPSWRVHDRSRRTWRTSRNFLVDLEPGRFHGILLHLHHPDDPLLSSTVVRWTLTTNQKWIFFHSTNQKQVLPVDWVYIWCTVLVPVCQQLSLTTNQKLVLFVSTNQMWLPGMAAVILLLVSFSRAALVFSAITDQSWVLFVSTNHKWVLPVASRTSSSSGLIISGSSSSLTSAGSRSENLLYTTLSFLAPCQPIRYQFSIISTNQISV